MTLYNYYGGKKKMAREICQLIPAHRVYCEPFFGSGAVFFSKPKSQVEMINDRLDIVINFWRTVRDQYSILKEEIDGSITCATNIL